MYRVELSSLTGFRRVAVAVGVRLTRFNFQGPRAHIFTSTVFSLFCLCKSLSYQSLHSLIMGRTGRHHLGVCTDYLQGRCRRGRRSAFELRMVGRSSINEPLERCSYDHPIGRESEQRTQRYSSYSASRPQHGYRTMIGRPHDSIWSATAHDSYGVSETQDVCLPQGQQRTSLGVEPGDQIPAIRLESLEDGTMDFPRFYAFYYHTNRSYYNSSGPTKEAVTSAFERAVRKLVADRPRLLESCLDQVRASSPMSYNSPHIVATSLA